MNLFCRLFLLCFIVIPTAFAAPKTPKLKVGMILPLSGHYAAIGQDTKRGVEVALTELGEGVLEVSYGDSQTEPRRAISEFQQMVDVEGVQGVFAFRGPIGMALNPLSKAKKNTSSRRSR